MTTTNEDIFTEAARLLKYDNLGNLSWTKAFVFKALELAASGWTKPEPVDPDLIEARKIGEKYVHYFTAGPVTEQLLLACIKRGRELANSGRPVVPVGAVAALRNEFKRRRFPGETSGTTGEAIAVILDYFAALEAGAK